jgi:hypothetical protein
MVPEPIDDHLIRQDDDMDPGAFLLQLTFDGGQVFPEKGMLRHVGGAPRELRLRELPFFSAEVSIDVVLQEGDGAADLGTPFALIACLEQDIDALKKLFMLIVDLKNADGEIVGPLYGHDRVLS